MILLVAALILAIVLSAVLSAAELAVFSLPESRVHALAEEGTPGAEALAALRGRPERVLVLLRLGDAFADVSAGALAATLVHAQWEMVGVAGAVGVMTFLVLYFGELLPIGFAINRGVGMALRIAPPLRFVTGALGPLLFVLARLARMAPDRRNGALSSITETELRQLTAVAGGIEEHERQLIERAFRLDDTKAWDIMTPRVDVFAWRDDQRLGEITGQLGTVRFSRVPVYRESIDDITGVLYVRDAYQALISGQRDVPLRTLAREPLVVPGSITLTRLLRDFQTRRIHLAVVVDEYGGTDGVVSLEDVLEELVGEIEDETDLAEEPILRISRNEVEASGDVDLREINHFFNSALPQLEHRSLNGYLLEELGHVPEAGDVFERHGVIIEVVEATDTQVIRARLKRAAPPRAPDAAEQEAGAPSPGQEPVVNPLPADAEEDTAPTALSDEDAGTTARDPRAGS